jgi:hypothetical protein
MHPQVRAEIGRRLRERYEASSSPMPDRLADLTKKIELGDPSPSDKAGDIRDAAHQLARTLTAENKNDRG